MIEVKYNWLCGKCQKKFVKIMIPKIKRYRKEGLSLREISKLTGIPKSTIAENKYFRTFGKQMNNKIIKNADLSGIHEETGQKKGGYG